MAPVHDHGNAEWALFLPLAFGMYTRWTGRGCHGPTWRCTRTATSARAWEVNATSPSTPAVVRPALRWVTCRTLTSVFDQDAQHELLQVPDLGQVPLLRRLEDPSP